MFATLVEAVAGMLLLAIGISFARLVRGPTLPDRVVALDLIAILSVGYLGVLTVAAEQPAYLDAALTLALIAFLATVAFARYVERTAGQDREAP